MQNPKEILFEFLKKHEISFDTWYIDDSDVAFDAIEEAMEMYANDQLRLQRQQLMSILTSRVLKIQSEPNGIVRETMINNLLVDINSSKN